MLLVIAISAVYAEYYVYRHVLQQIRSPSPSIRFDLKQTLNHLCVHSRVHRLIKVSCLALHLHRPTYHFTP